MEKQTEHSTDLASKIEAAHQAISAGDGDSLRDALRGISAVELRQLLSARSTKALVLTRPSSLGSVRIPRPNLLALSIAQEDNRFTSVVSGHRIGLDDRLPFDDSASSELQNEAPALVIAVMTGKLNAARSLVHNGAAIDATSSTGDTALMEACFEGCRDAASFLIENGADVNIGNAKCVTALMLAAYSGHTEIIELLLRSEAKPDAFDRSGRDALFYSVSGGHLTTLKTLLDKGLRPAADQRGMTLLMEAASVGQLDCMRHLVANMAPFALNMHDLDAYGRNSAFHAAESNHLDALRLLLDAGATLQRDSRGRSALMCACLKGNTPLVEYLLEYYDSFKLNVNEVDHDGRNCLFYAVTSGSVELFQRLLSAGARAGISRGGVTLLMQAAGKCQLATCRYIAQRLQLLDISADAQDEDGWTALSYAAAAGCGDIARVIISRGAHCLVTRDGKTPLMQAALSGDADLVAFLCEKASATGLDVHACDTVGWNALYYSLLSHQLPIFRYLLSQGLYCVVLQSGVTLLMEAVDRGVADLAKYLVDNEQRLDVDVSAVDSHGCNCLFYCAASGDSDTFRYIVDSNRAKVVNDGHGRTVLMQAAYNGHTELATYLLDNDVALGLDVNGKDKDGRNALFYCIEGGHLDLLLLLLDYGIPMQPDLSGKNNLFQAIAAGHWHIVEYIMNFYVQLGLDPNSVDHDGTNALGYYVKRPTDSRILKKLLAYGMKLDSGHNSLLTLLEHAMKTGDFASVKSLLSSCDVDVNVRRALCSMTTDCGCCSQLLFHWIARHDDIRLFESFATFYEPLKARDSTRRTPLMVACTRGESTDNAHLIAALLDASSADMNVLDAHGFDALRHAVASANGAAVRLLLLRGARVITVRPHAADTFKQSRRRHNGLQCRLHCPDAFMIAGRTGIVSIAQQLLGALPVTGARSLLSGCDSYGRTALHYACLAGSAEIVSLYLRVAPQLKDKSDASGCTPLMTAAAWGHTQTVANLLFCGASPSATDPTFRTALHYSVNRDDPSLTTIHTLCQQGRPKVDVDARDWTGITPLMAAAARGHMLAAKCLLDNGADPIACDYNGIEVIDYCKRGDHKIKTLINKFCEMPQLQMSCLEAKRDEFRQVVDVTRIMHMLQKRHVITPQLEAIVLADPSHQGRVDRLLGLLRGRGSHAFRVLCEALQAYYPVLGYELVKLGYATMHTQEAPS